MNNVDRLACAVDQLELIAEATYLRVEVLCQAPAKTTRELDKRQQLASRIRNVVSDLTSEANRLDHWKDIT